MEATDGGYFCARNGVLYREACPSLEAKYQGKEFASASKSLVFYEIPGELTSETLTTGFDHFSIVFRAETAKDLNLRSFEAAAVLICSESASGLFTADTVVRDGGATYRAILAALEGPEAEKPAGQGFSFAKTLRLDADSVKSFYYRLELIASTSGEVFLYDEALDKTVSAGDIFEGKLS